MREPIIYLDMDGVLFDFCKGALEAHGLGHRFRDIQGWHSLSDIFSEEGINFWGTTAQRPEFWANLEPIPGALEMEQRLFEAFPGRLMYATSPASPGSASGKLKCIRKHFSRRGTQQHRHFAVCAKKHLLASPNKLLIDDNEANVKMFEAEGGKALLFPHQHNGGTLDDIRDFQALVIEKVAAKLEE